MFRRSILAGLVVAAALTGALQTGTARAQSDVGQPTDWGRFYYYPYVYYPESFQRPTSFDSMYYRYPPNRRIPVYNKMWYNAYPSPRPYYRGHHFELDVF